MNDHFVIAIHGGAGTISPLLITHQQDSAYRATLTEALQIGKAVLERNGTAMDAVVAAVKVMENSPLFNAGKGSVFTHEGTNEMDAAVMDGLTLKAGAVAGVRTIKNPVMAARAVMDKSDFVLLSGRGAEEFAKEKELEIVDTSYFFEQFRWDQLEKVRDTKKTILDHSGNQQGMIIPPDALDPNMPKFGTVGAVALDKYGNLAAATSTGGLTNKRYNRIGDSPIIGCGTYANNRTCAVSCTGHGEAFIRTVAAHSLSSILEFTNVSLHDAAREVLHRLQAIKGKGGLIAVDTHGNVTMQFNTAGMYRGVANSKGETKVMIYKNN